MSDGDLLAAAGGVPSGLPAGVRLRTLRGLAGYRCGHSGSCCRAGWPIPVEPTPLALLRRAAAASALPAFATPDWLIDDHILGHSADSVCSFFDGAPPQARTGGCSIEREFGHEALSFSCRQFPRLLLADGRGWHISLSTWCGTAARMVVAPAADSDHFLSYDHIDVDGRVHLEFLDAREAWPPLLRPGVLAGLAAYDEWESLVLQRFLAPVVDGRCRLDAALDGLVRWTEWVRDWRSADGSLERRLHVPWRPRPSVGASRTAATNNLLNDLIDRVPPAWRPEAWPAGLTDATAGGQAVSRQAAEAALARYLATRLVGSWIAYQGEGLRSVNASLVAACALAVEALRTNGDGPPTFGRMTSAIRAADWLLLHLLERSDWARWCADHETGAGAERLLGLVHDSGRTLAALPWAE